MAPSEVKPGDFEGDVAKRRGMGGLAAIDEITMIAMPDMMQFANGSGTILGVEPQMSEISYLPLKDGRWLNDLDSSQRRNVIVLGSELQKTLFPGWPALGAL